VVPLHGFPAWSAAFGEVYCCVTRASLKRDQPTFEVACQGLEELSASHAPGGPQVPAAEAHSLAYRRTGVVALWYRGAKRRLRR
jgi:hypothetical protein